MTTANLAIKYLPKIELTVLKKQININNNVNMKFIYLFCA